MRIVVVLVLLLAVPESSPGQRSADLPSGTATRPSTTRPSSLAEARRVVFLVDTRIQGFLLGRVKEEVNLAVDHLREEQMFTIIECRPQSKVPRVFSVNPIRATQGQKDAAVEFVRRIEDERDTNVAAGVRKAVELQPDLLVFIAGDGTPEMDAIRQAFRPLRGRLNIVLFTVHGPHPVEFLRTLALEHGGVAMDQKGNVLEAPKTKVEAVKKPESRPSVLEK